MRAIESVIRPATAFRARLRGIAGLASPPAESEAEESSRSEARSPPGAAPSARNRSRLRLIELAAQIVEPLLVFRARLRIEHLAGAAEIGSLAGDVERVQIAPRLGEQPRDEISPRASRIENVRPS